jgi:hypothetical protein
MGASPRIKFIEKSISLFGDNPDIYLNTSLNYFSTTHYSKFVTLSLGSSSMCTANT